LEIYMQLLFYIFSSLQALHPSTLKNPKSK
jgi:hypothetical protein